MEKTLWSGVFIVALMIGLSQGCEWDIDVIGCKDLYDNRTRQELMNCLDVCLWKHLCTYVTFTFGEFASACRLEYGRPNWRQRLHGTLYRLSKDNCKAIMTENRGCLNKWNDYI